MPRARAFDVSPCTNPPASPDSSRCAPPNDGTEAYSVGPRVHHAPYVPPWLVPKSGVVFAVTARTVLTLGAMGMRLSRTAVAPRLMQAIEGDGEYALWPARRWNVVVLPIYLGSAGARAHATIAKTTERGEVMFSALWASISTMVTPSIVIACVALLVSVTAAVIGWRNYRRKSSLHLRGYAGVAQSTECDDRYVSSVVIENLKDRAVSIYAIYLRVGHSYYIQIEDFEGKSPLILRPFETWHQKYGPIDHYTVSSKRIAMNSVLSDKRAKQTLVLSTTEGKYVIKKAPKVWSPLAYFFRNHMTAVVQPRRVMHEGQDIGGNIAYVVKIVAKGEPELILLQKRDFEVIRFKSFRLTADSLKTADALREFLQAQIEQGALVCSAFEVFDMEAWRERHRSEFPDQEHIDAEYIGFFMYRVLGRIGTILADRKLAKSNRHLAKRRASAAPRNP